jgi:hypothetical protein
MPALKLSIITSMILFTLLSFLPTRTVGTIDNDRSDINAALLRQMASRGAKHIVEGGNGGGPGLAQARFVAD